MRYIHNLSKEEKGTLENGHRTGSTSRYRNRCQAILLSHQGYKINELSKMYSVNRDTICRWFNDWESEGIEGLLDDTRSGRPAKLSVSNEEHINEVKRLLKEECQKLDKVRGELEESLGIEVSKRTLQRFLKVLAFDGDVFDYHLKNDKVKKSIKPN